MPAGQVLQVGTDAAGRALGLHPRLGGLLNIFNEGRLALVQRTGYPNSSRSHFEATDIWGTANPQSSTGSGWLGRYLDTLPRPLDALAAWNTTGETPRALLSGQSGVPAIPNATTYTYASPNRGSAALAGAGGRAGDGGQPGGRPAASGIREQHQPRRDRDARPRGAGDGRIRRRSPIRTTASRWRCAPSRAPSSAASAHGCSGCRPAASTRTRGRAQAGGAYGNLMGTLGDGLGAFYSDVRNQGLADDTTVIVFSEFGRRISENGSAGTDHGAAGVMMVLGGTVRGGLYGTAASLAPGNPTLENNSGDVRHETDFRSVYARLLDQWLGVNSVPILNGDFRAGAPAIF